MKEFYDLRTRLPPDPDLPGFLREWGWSGAGVVAAGPPVPGLFPVTLLPESPRNRGLKGAVFVATGSKEELRKAARHPAVDALSTPGFLDTVTARFAAESGVAVELCVGDLLRLRGGNRVRALQRLRHNALLAKKAKAPVLLTSGAESRAEVRAPEDLASFGVVAGLTREDALAGFGRVPRRILGRRGLV
ncbi:MAG: RNase P subunit p30 family protein [Halobacteria archaeon]